MFCEHCGRKLSEGEICNCQGQNQAYAYTPPSNNKSYVPPHQTEKAQKNSKTVRTIVISLLIIFFAVTGLIMVWSYVDSGNMNSWSASNQTESGHKYFSADISSGREVFSVYYDNGIDENGIRKDRVEQIFYTWTLTDKATADDIENAKEIHKYISKQDKEGISVSSEFTETSSEYELRLHFYLISYISEEKEKEKEIKQVINTATTVFKDFDKTVKDNTVKLSLMEKWLTQDGFKQN